jgi:ParB-like chromosome segregation protein Spo0J
VDKIINAIKEYLSGLSIENRIEEINKLRIEIHNLSPLNKEPVDCVLWIKNTLLEANDYNPNSVAPPEMELLRTSIMNDGYTQPIVAFKEDEKYTVIDGFHRNRVGKECDDVNKRIMGYLPIAIINNDREDRGDRIAATIRHNRARGKHKIDSMSDIVVELKKRNWSDEKIGKELGMEPDEGLRLCQISGLSELFKNKEFSEAWEVPMDEKPL